MMDDKALYSTTDYGYRFGKIAIMKGFITEQQLVEVLDDQIDHNLMSDNHKFIGEIFLEKGWMTQDQIGIVLENLSNIKTYSSSYLIQS